MHWEGEQQELWKTSNRQRSVPCCVRIWSFDEEFQSHTGRNGVQRSQQLSIASNQEQATQFGQDNTFSTLLSVDSLDQRAISSLYGERAMQSSCCAPGERATEFRLKPVR